MQLPSTGRPALRGRVPIGIIAWVCAGGSLAAAPGLADLSLEDLMRIEVTGASKYAQTLAAAPSAVGVATREDIRAFGWRTLADVLNAQRGIHVANDRTYRYVGMRGFAPPGDLNNRILFLIDGMRVNDNVYDSVMAGATFPLDLELVERIEIVRGPGAAMYGGNALFGVVNVITRSGAALDGVEGGIGVGARGRSGARVAAGRSKEGVDWLLSASGERSDGGRFEFADVAPGVRSPAGADAERWQRLFGRFSAGDWRGQLVYGKRAKHVPTASYGTIPNDGAHREDDAYTLAELERHLHLDDKNSLTARLFAGHYRYDSVLPYDYSGEAPPRAARMMNRDLMEGQWQGFEARWERLAWAGQRWLVGVEGVTDRRMRIFNADDDGTTAYDLRPSSRRWGVFAQNEIQLSQQTALTLGLRHDKTRGREGHWSPRLALVRQLSPDHTLKALYGSAFRHANPSERFGAFAKAGLKPEILRNAELVWESRLDAGMQLAASLYRYGIVDPIGFDNAANRQENGAPVAARGGELELSQRTAGGLWWRASYSVQSVRQSGRRPDNSPAGLLKLHASLPIAAAWQAGVEWLATGQRRNLNGGAAISGAALANLNLAYRPAGADWEAALRIENLFDRRYDDPAPADPWFAQTRGFQRSVLARDGRLLGLQLTARFR